MDRLYVVLYFALNTIVLLVGVVLVLLDEKAVSSSLIAAGIIGYIVFWASYIHSRRSHRDVELLRRLKQFGIADINERRLLYGEYAKARKKTRNCFDIMGFGLRNFMEDMSDQFNEWSKSFTIRILVINPKSPYCIQRDYEERDSPGKIKNDVIFATKTVLDLNNQRVKIRWYDAIPVTNILRMDGIMWVGPYFMYERSRNAYILTLTEKGQLFEQYREHFKRIWNDPKLSCYPDLSKVE